MAKHAIIYAKFTVRKRTVNPLAQTEFMIKNTIKTVFYSKPYISI